MISRETHNLKPIKEMTLRDEEENAMRKKAISREKLKEIETEILNNASEQRSLKIKIIALIVFFSIGIYLSIALI